MKSSYKLPIRSETEQTLLDQENQEYFEKQGSKQAAGPTSLLHENLRSFRLRRHYKKREMAEFMRVTPRTYYTYENGSRPVPSSALVNLATITKIDLNELMLGRRATPDAQIAQAAIVDMQLIMKMLRAEYPDMDADTRYEVACCAITTDWGDWPRMHPEIIHAALFKVTQYRYFPEDLPAPPFLEDYDGDRDSYEKDLEEWQAATQEYSEARISVRSTS